MAKRTLFFNPLRSDPTRTGLLRRQFATEMYQRFTRLKAAIRTKIKEGMLGQFTVNAARRGKWATNKHKIELFNQWLDQQIGDGILQRGQYEPWTVKYTNRAYTKGYARTYGEVRKTRSTKQGQAEFMRRIEEVNTGKLEILASRAYEDLKGVTASMASAISRELVSGVLNGDSPETIAIALASKVDIGLTRARTLARTEIAHAHAESQLDAMEDLGLSEVGVMVEWVNGINPCPKCARQAGKVMTIRQARGKIPVHPHCYCAFVPISQDDGQMSRLEKRFSE
jgi:hypothetical protein